MVVIKCLFKKIFILPIVIIVLVIISCIYCYICTTPVSKNSDKVTFEIKEGSTIKEITDKCGLKRQTFYNHFKDKYDLIKWIYLNEVIVKIEHDDCWIEKYRDIFKYFLDNKYITKEIAKIKLY